MTILTMGSNAHYADRTVEVTEEELKKIKQWDEEYGEIYDATGNDDECEALIKELFTRPALETEDYYINVYC